MEGYLLLEVFQWNNALDQFLKAKYIYEHVLKCKDELEQAIYKEKCG
jgi:hypothetical protein